MKGRYYVILLGIVVLGLIVGIWRLRSGTPSSPEATVKAFYEALNQGNFSKAKQYMSPQWDSLPFGIEGLKAIVGGIQKVEIEGTSTEKAFGSEITRVIVKVTLKPGVEEKLRALHREADKKAKVMKHRSLKGEVPLSASTKAHEEEGALRDFPERFQEKHTWSLQKWDGKWKISGWR